ncbi:hypothetical protein Tco_1255558 [Tanacetum coccineum]
MGDVTVLDDPRRGHPMENAKVTRRVTSLALLDTNIHMMYDLHVIEKYPHTTSMPPSSKKPNIAESSSSVVSANDHDLSGGNNIQQSLIGNEVVIHMSAIILKSNVQPQSDLPLVCNDVLSMDYICMMLLRQANKQCNDGSGGSDDASNLVIAESSFRRPAPFETAEHESLDLHKRTPNHYVFLISRILEFPRNPLLIRLMYILATAYNAIYFHDFNNDFLILDMDRIGIYSVEVLEKLMDLELTRKKEKELVEVAMEKERKLDEEKLETFKEEIIKETNDNIWMAFGGKTRDLGSIGEETDKTTTLHQSLLKNSVQCLETASRFLATTSYHTSDGGRFPRRRQNVAASKETLEDLTERWLLEKLMDLELTRKKEKELVEEAMEKERKLDEEKLETFKDEIIKETNDKFAEPDDGLVDTPLISPFLDSDDGEVLYELEEYGSFTYITEFVVLEDIGEFIVSDMTDVVMGNPFRKVTNLEYDCAKGLIYFTRIFDNYTF